MTRAVALEVRALSRWFGQRAAVRDLDLTIQEGDVYGFLGPNGAGKTTVMRCVLGLIRYSGQIRIFDEQGHTARRHVGALIETPAFHDWLSGRRNLELSAATAGLSSDVATTQVDRVLERVGLTERARDPAGAYSLGMRQRLAIARALLGRPRLLMLDEPTNGLDPQGMREVRELVRSLALHDNITVFISSHLLAEVQATCNRVAILAAGQLSAEGAVADLLAGDAMAAVRVEVGASDPASLQAAAEALHGVTAEGAGHAGRQRFRLVGVTVPDLVRHLVGAGVAVDAVVPDHRDLEAVFLEVTSGAPQ